MSISAGRVVVNGNVVLDSSGTNSTAYLNAVKISADTVSANTIIATNINYNDLDVSGNITAPIANITTANIGTGNIGTANITTGVITSLSGTTISNFSTGVITSLSGVSSTFGTGVFGSLDASGARFDVVNANNGKFQVVDTSSINVGSVSGVSSTFGTGVFGSLDASGARFDVVNANNGKFQVVDTSSINVGSVSGVSSTFGTGVFGSLDTSGARFDVVNANNGKFQVVDTSSINVGSVSGVSSTFGTGVFGSLDASGARFDVVNANNGKFQVVDTSSINVGSVSGVSSTFGTGVFGSLDASGARFEVVDSFRGNFQVVNSSYIGCTDIYALSSNIGTGVFGSLDSSGARFNVVNANNGKFQVVDTSSINVGSVSGVSSTFGTGVFGSLDASGANFELIDVFRGEFQIVNSPYIGCTNIYGVSSTINSGVFGSLDASGANFNVVNANNCTLASVTSYQVISGLLQGTVNVPATSTFDCLGLNKYEGKFQNGDIIDYTIVASLSAGQTNTYMKTYLDFGQASGTTSGTFWQDTSYNMIAYQISYWANDFLANSLQRLSATLIIPYLGDNPFAPTGLPNNSAIVSYKHGTLTSTYQNTTLWRAMGEAAAVSPVYDPVINGSLNIDPTAWMLSATGYITVCADNVSYGKSTGYYDFANVQDESLSQYASVVATTQLMRTTPLIFYNQFVAASSINVINSGYSLGGLNSVFISQLIRNNQPNTRNPYYNTNPNSIPLNLIQTISAGATNVYKLTTQVLETNYNSPTIWPIFLFLMLLSGDPQILLKDSMRPNILSSVFPSFNQFYANTNITSVSQFINLQASAYYSITDAYSKQNGGPQSISPTNTAAFPLPLPNNYFSFTDPTQPSTTGYITPNQFYYNPYFSDCSSHNFGLNFGVQNSFFTNNFVDYSDLSGTPITVIYSTGDELCCPNAGSSYVYDTSSESIYTGIPSKDVIYTDYSNWVNVPNPYANGIANQGKTWVDVSGGLVLGGYISTIDASGVIINPMAATLLTTENTNTASIVRVNYDPAGTFLVPQPAQNAALQHFAFGITAFQLGFRTYLKNRP
jgi:hypothetical protein